jgi:hypothetical protein
MMGNIGASGDQLKDMLMKRDVASVNARTDILIKKVQVVHETKQHNVSASLPQFMHLFKKHDVASVNTMTAYPHQVRMLSSCKLSWAILR